MYIRKFTSASNFAKELRILNGLLFLIFFSTTLLFITNYFIVCYSFCVD